MKSIVKARIAKKVENVEIMGGVVLYKDKEWDLEIYSSYIAAENDLIIRGFEKISPLDVEQNQKGFFVIFIDLFGNISYEVVELTDWGFSA